MPDSHATCAHMVPIGVRCTRCDELKHSFFNSEPSPFPFVPSEVAPARQSISFLPGAMEPRMLDGLNAVITKNGQRIQALADLIANFAAAVEQRERKLARSSMPYTHPSDANTELGVLALAVKEEALRIAADPELPRRGPGPQERG